MEILLPNPLFFGFFRCRILSQFYVTYVHLRTLVLILGYTFLYIEPTGDV